MGEENLYASKNFLLALRDAHDCLRTAAKYRGEDQAYKESAGRLLNAKNEGLVEFKDGHVVKGPKWTAAKSGIPTFYS